MGTALGLVGVFALIIATGFFVASEYSFVTVDRTRTEQAADAGDERAGRVRRIVRRLPYYLSGTQLGITIAALALGFVAEPSVASVFEPALGRGLSIVVALVLVTVASMLLGELVPKNYAIARSDDVARAVARPMLLYSAAFGPLIRTLHRAANAVVGRLGFEPHMELSSARSIEELELVIRSSGDKGMLDPGSLTLLTRTLRFSEKTAADALVPRVQVHAVQPDDSIPALIQRAVSTGSSRFPVCREDLDDIVGVVHVKDVYRIPAEQRDTAVVADVMAEPFVVPETRDLTSLLLELRSGSHMAVVVDEYGGTAGIITLEDVLEEIVGDIDDEYDLARPALTKLLPSGTFELPGALHLDEVQEASGLEIPEGEYETLAGFVLDQLGRIPDVGDRFVHEGWLLEVVAMERHRIETVRLTAPPRGPA